jgi:hypothetical protein
MLPREKGSRRKNFYSTALQVPEIDVVRGIESFWYPYAAKIWSIVSEEDIEKQVLPSLQNSERDQSCSECLSKKFWQRSANSELEVTIRISER